MVQGIGRLGTNLHFHLFANRKVLIDREVELIEGGSGQSVACDAEGRSEILIGCQGVVNPVDAR